MNPHYMQLAFVPRWSIIRTIRQESVAEHSYFVAVITKEICDILRTDSSKLGEFLWYALDHDIEESITSDIPSPIKNYIEVKYEKLYPELARRRLNINPPTPYVWSIVKLADIAACIFYLQSERLMGNGTINDLMKTMTKAFHDHLDSIDESMVSLSKVRELRQWLIVRMEEHNHTIEVLK